MGKIWDKVDALIARQPILTAGGEFLAAHFEAQEKLRGVPPEGYGRRPLLGLRFKIDGKETLTCKPAWTAAVWHHSDGTHHLVKAGIVHINRVEIELINPGITLRMAITEDGAKLGRCMVSGDQTMNIDNIKTVCATFRKLLDDPAAAFAEQSDHCCCCGKALTDVTSRLRGIGPECIKYFADCAAVAKSIREKYRSLDAEWWAWKEECVEAV